MADQSWENRGDTACECCGALFFADELRNPRGRNPYGPDSDELWCEACIADAAEKQAEADAEDYYGGV